MMTLDIDQIKRKIIQVIQEHGRNVIGLSLKDIAKHIGSIEGDLLKRAVGMLIQENQIEERNPHSRSKIYNLPGEGGSQLDLFMNITAREEVERESADQLDLYLEEEETRSLGSYSVLRQIAEDHVAEENFVDELKRIAHDFARENPIDLVLGMGTWFVQDINAFAQRTRQTQIKTPKAAGKLRAELGFRCKKAERFFRRLLRLEDALYLPSVRDFLNGKTASFNVEIAQEKLKKRIVGDQMISLVDIPANTIRAAVGSDASIGDIAIPRNGGSFIPSTPANLFIAGGAMRVANSGLEILPRYWDFDIDPKNVEDYEDVTAAMEGLFISPKMRETITDYRHLVSAAMELQQYKEERRVVMQQAKWTPYGIKDISSSSYRVGLLFRDGRIFPLVHRLADYDGSSTPDDVLYGVIVRKEIDTFQQVFHATAGAGRAGAIYAGAVKSPEFSWFAMMVFWYLAKNQNSSEIPYFYRAPLNDQAVTHILFWSLCEGLSDLTLDSRRMYVTARVIRRYSDIAFNDHPVVIENDSKRHVNEDSESDWSDYITSYIEAAERSYEEHRRGIPSLEKDDYTPFLDLCRRAGVAMFYASPIRMYEPTIAGKSHFLLPRWEICVDVSQPGYQKYLEDTLVGMLGWLVDTGGLVPDHEHAVQGFEEPMTGLPLFLPDVIVEAHRIVTSARDMNVQGVVDLLQEHTKAVRSSLQA